MRSQLSEYYWGPDWKLRTRDNTTEAEWQVALDAGLIFGLNPQRAADSLDKLK